MPRIRHLDRHAVDIGEGIAVDVDILAVSMIEEYLYALVHRVEKCCRVMVVLENP